MPAAIVCRSSREDREDFDLKAAEGATGKRGRPDGAPAGAGSAGGKRVFVNNLAEETTWQALKDYFKQAGPVAHADVLTVRRSQCPGQNSFSKVVTSVMFHLLLLNVQQPPVTLCFVERSRLAASLPPVKLCFVEISRLAASLPRATK